MAPCRRSEPDAGTGTGTGAVMQGRAGQEAMRTEKAKPLVASILSRSKLLDPYTSHAARALSKSTSNTVSRSPPVWRTTGTAQQQAQAQAPAAAAAAGQRSAAASPSTHRHTRTFNKVRVKAVYPPPTPPPPFISKGKGHSHSPPPPYTQSVCQSPVLLPPPPPPSTHTCPTAYGKHLPLPPPTHAPAPKRMAIICVRPHGSNMEGTRIMSHAAYMR